MNEKIKTSEKDEYTTASIKKSTLQEVINLQRKLEEQYNISFSVDKIIRLLVEEKDDKKIKIRIEKIKKVVI